MFIVIEGVDGSGKQTQSQILFDKLSLTIKTKKIQFPNYDSNSSALVKMYLAGEFGSNADDVSPYVASSFYAVDRIASYLKDWKKDLDSGTVIIADRYTTSNAVHQAGKIKGDERDVFLDWLFDYEYNVLKLPKPDVVIFLDMPPEYGRQLMENRNNKITGESEKDIHERDFKYLHNAYNCAIAVAKKYNWNIISCVKEGVVRSVDDIHKDILRSIIE